MGVTVDQELFEVCVSFLIFGVFYPGLTAVWAAMLITTGHIVLVFTNKSMLHHLLIKIG